MDALDWIVGIAMLSMFVWFVVTAWLDSKDESESGSETEREQGIVPSAMQNDMMDRG